MPSRHVTVEPSHSSIPVAIRCAHAAGLRDDPNITLGRRVMIGCALAAALV